MSKWYLNQGQDEDIVFSVRIRLARNLSSFPFSNKMSDEQKYDVIQRVSDAIFKSSVSKEYKFVDLNKLEQYQLYSLAERHLISIEFAKNPNGRALILKNDESVSIMINEEDHIRIQALSTGLEFENALKSAFEVEKILNDNLEFAFDNKLGYLTECPSNLGTGMRASAMVHLPGLESLGALDKLFNSVSKLGIAIRGTFGEGTKAKSSMYQISNQVTLGISEDEIINNIKNIILQVINKEKLARNSFQKDYLEDLSFRALGTLKFARKLSSDELLELLSKLRLGVSNGFVNVPVSVINKLNLEFSSAGICDIAGKQLDTNARDDYRAKNVRNLLENYN